MERKILLFAKLMSICFAGMALLLLIDTVLKPNARIHYVLAHECETGYKSTSKFGATHVRDNYLYCVSFRSIVPYRLRQTNEIDTNLLYPSVEDRIDQAKQQKAEFQVLQVPVDLISYYELEDGDSIRLFLSPLRGKVMGYTQYKWKDWLMMGEEEMGSHIDDLNPDLNQWILTTKVFCVIALLLCAMTWLIPVFHISVGMFVFNCVISALLFWVY